MVTDREGDLDLGEEKLVDERVPAQFRKALGSKNGELVQRAAFALASLDRKEAIPELIEVLTGRARKLIDVPLRAYFGEFAEVFAGDTSVRIGERRSVTITQNLLEMLQLSSGVSLQRFGFEGLEVLLIIP